MDQDVPSGHDPSWKSSTNTETRDNGVKGNDCDPGFGGSNNENGNDGGHHGVPNVSETEASGCTKTTGGNGGGGQPPQTTPPGTTPTGQVAGITTTATTGRGGGVAGAFGGGVAGAFGGVGAAAGVALAETGLQTVGFALLALLLLVLGAMLMWRRPQARSTL